MTRAIIISTRVNAWPEEAREGAREEAREGAREDTTEDCLMDDSAEYRVGVITSRV